MKNRYFAMRMKKFFGWLFIFTALLANEWVIRAYFYHKVFWTFGARFQTLLAQTVLIFIGIVLLRAQSAGLSLSAYLASLVRRHKEVFSVLVGLGISLALVGILSVGFFHFKNRNLGPGEIREGFDVKTFIEEDVILGFRPKPDNVTYSKLVRDGKLVYDVQYEIDEFARRKSDLPQIDRSQDFVAVFGGSVVFGEGLPTQHTLPSFLARLTGKKTYNYGFLGYGANQMLALLEARPLVKEIPEKNGTLVYPFWDGYVEFTIGSMSVYNNWGAFTPYYALENDIPVRHGNFTSGRPWSSLGFWILGKTRLPSLFRMNIPRAIGDEHLWITAKIVEKSKDLFLQQYPAGKFVVVFYPGSVFKDKMISYFQKLGVAYLDKTDVFKSDDPAMSIPGDAHPSHEAFEKFSQSFAGEI